ncbi:MAG: heme NO-binding domain-containing protein [Acidobacteriota bacterium]
MANVKGSKISSKLAFVRDEYGDEMVTEVVRSLGPADQESLRMILETGWYPIELYERVMKAICKTAARGDASVYARIGRYSAEEVLTTTYRIFRGRSPVDALNKMVPMHTMMNDPGEMEVVSQSEGQCTIKVLKPRSTETICRVANYFYERAVELCGGANVQVREVKCSARGAAFCQFDITWDKSE